MREDILALAEGICSPGEAERPLLEALCVAAEAEAAGRLREDVPAEDCREALICAGALLAAAGLIACRSRGGDVSSFTAGDVTIRREEGGNCLAAAALRRQAAAVMAPYWADDGFAFAEVRG